MKNKEDLFIFVLVLTDQIIKIFIDTLMNLNQMISLPFGFSLTKLYNYGVSFGFLNNERTLIIAITVIAIICLLKIKESFTNKYYVLSINLIIAGGLGNLIDRILHGYVIDYIQCKFIKFPIFNFADILVSLGFMLMVLLLFLGKDIDEI